MEPPPPPTLPTATIVTARPVRLREPRRFDFWPRSRLDILLDLFIVLTIGFALPSAVQVALLMSVPVEEFSIPSVHELAFGKYLEALLVVVLAWLLCKFRGYSPDALGARTDRLGQQLLWSIPALMGVYVGMFMTILPIMFLVLQFDMAEQDLANRVEFMEMLPIHDPWMAFILLVAVAIHEEVLFRGLMIPYLRYLGLPWALAICIPCAVFALLHVSQGVLGIVQVFFVGLVLSLFFVWTRSLLAVIIAHFLFNFIQLQMVRVLGDLVEFSEELA